MPRIYSLETSEAWGTGEVSRIDTTLNDFHRYLPTYYSQHAQLGGFALRGYSLTPSFRNDLLSYGFRPYVWYNKGDEDVRYYQVSKPFSRAFFVSGPQNEQYLDVLHAQRITNDWYAGLNMIFGGADGVYTRQKTGYTHIELNTAYQSQNKRYGVHGNVMINRINSEENGGLISDSTFESTDNINRQGGAVFLNSATNQFRALEGNVHQYWNFGGDIPQRPDTAGLDSITADSLWRLPLPEYKPAYRLFHHGQVTQSLQRYEDTSPDSTYYEPLFTYLDSVGILDSLRVARIENTVGIALLAEDSATGLRSFEYSLMLTHQNFSLWQNSKGRVFDNVLVAARIDGPKQGDSRWQLSANQVVLGWNSGDYSLNGWWQGPLGPKISTARIAGGIEQRLPEYVYHFYQNDYFAWDSTLSANTTVWAKGMLENDEWKARLSGAYETHTALAYFDDSSRTAQAGSSATLLRLAAEKDFRFRNWHLDGRFWYQTTAGADVIRVPELMAMGSFYWEGRLFRKVMLAQAGFDVTWYSAYRANTFEAATGQFRLQNDRNIGNYPFVDAYIAFKVKKAKVFVKAFHVNQGFPNYAYYQLPGFPDQGRAIKFGINWIFFD